MSAINNIDFSREQFLSLGYEEKCAIYRHANLAGNLPLVERLNDFGMKPKDYRIYSPSIISPFMDIATKRSALHNYLQHLRSQNRLLGQTEFNTLPHNIIWLKKYSFSRILGCDHIARIINEFAIKHFSVPKKIAVLKSEKSDITFKGSFYDKGYYNLETNNLDVYAEEVSSCDRKLSNEEMDELFLLIEKSRYTDLWPANFIIAEKATYLIDTEFNSFSHSINWTKLKRFMSIVKDRQYLEEMIQERIQKKSEPFEEDRFNFHTIQMILRTLQKNPNPEDEEPKKIYHNYLYVGGDVLGTDGMHPDIYTFSLKEILPA